jgi:hypothetical protein
MIAPEGELTSGRPGLSTIFQLRPAALYSCQCRGMANCFSTGVYKFARQTMTTVVKCKSFNPLLFTYRM